MPVAVFVAQLDDLQGFLVKQRYPDSLVVTEKILNMMFLEHQQDKKAGLKVSEAEGVRVASYSEQAYPGWFVCFVIEPEEDLAVSGEQMIGMSRLILELMNEVPERVRIGEIMRDQSVLSKRSEEQKCAAIFLTPSTALLLEKMQMEGVERAAKLALWLRNQVQSDDIDLREAISPLMEAGIVKVEMVGKTAEMVFLLKDLFGYRAPPIEALAKLTETSPAFASKYRDQVVDFFSPAPPARGYNPALPIELDSPIMEDRRKISDLLSRSLYYEVIKCLRSEVRTEKEIAVSISVPVEAVKSILWALEKEGIVRSWEEEKIWALITNPKIELFMPEYILPMISKKLIDKEITYEIASRHLDLLIQTWSENG